MSREHNAAHGIAFEEAVVTCLNKLPNNIQPDIVTDASKAANALVKKYGAEILPVTRIGMHTKSENGDIKLADGRVCEIKYVQCGTGTWYNTSIDLIADAIHAQRYSDFLYAHGYQKWLADILDGIANVNITNESPVSMHDSHEIRHNHSLLYQRIRKTETVYRKQYVQEIATSLANSSEEQATFVRIMLTKQASGKQVPDVLIIQKHHSTTTILPICDILADMSAERQEIAVRGCSLVMPLLRCTFAWQNGTGLNNPTIRVFLTLPSCER